MNERIDAMKLAPKGYQAVNQLEQYVRSTLDHTVLELIKLRASILNGCAFCVDLHTRTALESGESSRRLFSVAVWRESPFFDERERSALALTDAVTRLEPHGVPDDVWAEAAKHWSEEELVHLVLAISTINVWNRLAVTFQKQPPTL